MSWALSLFFFTHHEYSTRQIYLWEVQSHTLTESPSVKGSFTTVEVSRVTAPIKLTPGLCKMYIAIKRCYLKTVTAVVNLKTLQGHYLYLHLNFPALGVCTVIAFRSDVCKDGTNSMKPSMKHCAI